MKLEDLPAARVVITGSPRAGKTSACDLFETLGYPVRHTDELVGKFEWSEASLLASTWLEHPGPWVCEGTTMVRALRKYLGRHPGTLRPCDLLLWYGKPVVEVSDGQEIMRKGHGTIWRQVLPELHRRGVEVKIMSEVDCIAFQSKVPTRGVSE